MPTLDKSTPTGSEPVQARLPLLGALHLFHAGRAALSEVKGLNALIIKGFILLYALFLILGAVATLGIYFYVVQPISLEIAAWREGQELWIGLIAGLLKGLLWLGQFVLLVVTLLISLRLTLVLMGVWFELLVERIVRDRRQLLGEMLPEPPGFGLLAWLRGLGRALRASALTLLLSVCALVVGVIPFVGPALALASTAYLMGRDLREPYISVMEGLGEDALHMRRGAAWWTFKLGLPVTLVGLVPFVGWLVLPTLMIYLVAGVAWQGEMQRIQAMRAQP